MINYCNPMLPFTKKVTSKITFDYNHIHNMLNFNLLLPGIMSGRQRVTDTIQLRIVVLPNENFQNKTPAIYAFLDENTFKLSYFKFIKIFRQIETNKM